MPNAAKFGSKIRMLRRRHGLRQVDLAEKLGISPSYLNLIEHDQRALTAPLLLKVAELFPGDLKSFGNEGHGRLVSDLHEVFGDALFEAEDVTTTDLREAAANETVSRAVVKLYRAYRNAVEAMRDIASQVSDGGEQMPGIDAARLPSEEISDVLQENHNYFPELEEAAERLAAEAGLERADPYPGLVQYLQKSGIEVAVATHPKAKGSIRRYDPAEKRLYVSEILSRYARNFQIAHQIGLLSLTTEFEQILKRSRLTTRDSEALCRVALANYFAAALLMPYGPFVESARSLRYDIELLERRFGVSFEQVCHRLTTLRRPGLEGVPFHFIRVDIAGNISKHFSASGIRFARFSGLCPRWNVHSAFMTPGILRTQISKMPDGTAYLCVARTVRQSLGGFGAAHPLHAISLGCEIQHAPHLVYGDGLDVHNTSAAVPIGITCRLCERTDCEQRAFPPVHRRLGIDENVRGASFYEVAEKAEKESPA
ncbi:MAG TPA: short-chain fatty acyl-CoA regulator family protein [Thermoanaerobaculia bacterium]